MTCKEVARQNHFDIKGYLEEHSPIVSDMKYTIRHASRNAPNGYGSEYIFPKEGKIDITSHGLGSGIYGLSETKMMRPDSVDSIDGGALIDFTMETPFIVTNETSNRIINASMALNGALEKDKQLFIPDSLIELKNELAESYTRHFMENMGCLSERLTMDGVHNAIMKFMHDYYDRETYVMMPINYILLEHGYDGILGTPDSDIDSFSKGSVIFLPYEKEMAIYGIDRVYARVPPDKKWTYTKAECEECDTGSKKGRVIKPAQSNISSVKEEALKALEEEDIIEPVSEQDVGMEKYVGAKIWGLAQKAVSKHLIDPEFDPIKQIPEGIGFGTRAIYRKAVNYILNNLGESKMF